MVDWDGGGCAAPSIIFDGWPPALSMLAYCSLRGGPAEPSALRRRPNRSPGLALLLQRLQETPGRP